MPDEALRQQLNVGAAGFVRLKLCRRPSAGQLRRQVRALAAYTGAAAGALEVLLRAVDELSTGGEGRQSR